MVLLPALKTPTLADAADADITRGTEGKVGSCAEVKAAGLCEHAVAKQKCAASCAVLDAVNSTHVAAAAKGEDALLSNRFASLEEDEGSGYDGQDELDAARQEYEAAAKHPRQRAALHSGACVLHVITSHSLYPSISTLLNTNASAASEEQGTEKGTVSGILPWWAKSALVNYEVVRASKNMKITLYTSPHPDENGVASSEEGGRLLAWYKISLVQQLLAQRKAAKASARRQIGVNETVASDNTCPYVLWLDPDAFFVQPDVDYVKALIEHLPVWVRTEAPPSKAGHAARVKDVAMVGAVEANTTGVMFACDGCMYNGGVLLFNLDHPKLGSFLDAWWNSPLTGVCDASMFDHRLAEQDCLNRLVAFNETSRQTYAAMVAEADLLTLNTPFGRLVRHAWGGDTNWNMDPDLHFDGNFYSDPYSMQLKAGGMGDYETAKRMLGELADRVRPLPQAVLAQMKARREQLL